MKPFFSKWVIITIVILAVFGVALYSFFINNKTPTSLPKVVPPKNLGLKVVIGSSVEGREIDSYVYGNGDTHIAFVGGIHGGYEWNSVLLAYNFMDYLTANPEAIPANLTTSVIPSANPDGVYKVIGKEGRFTLADVPVGVSEAPGRFNANGVDLNRNFDCQWQATSTWQNKPESGGTAPFSEPEAQAIRTFILKDKPVGVVFWHSMSNAVYASQCEKGILPKTLDIMNAYATAAGYPAIKTFAAYATTGAAEDWLASMNIPAITVELKTHETVEWNKNLAGILALFKYYASENKI